MLRKAYLIAPIIKSHPYLLSSNLSTLGLLLLCNAIHLHENPINKLVFHILKTRLMLHCLAIWESFLSFEALGDSFVVSFGLIFLVIFFSIFEVQLFVICFTCCWKMKLEFRKNKSFRIKYAFYSITRMIALTRYISLILIGRL